MNFRLTNPNFWKKKSFDLQGNFELQISGLNMSQTKFVRCDQIQPHSLYQSFSTTQAVNMLYWNGNLMLCCDFCELNLWTFLQFMMSSVKRLTSKKAASTMQMEKVGGWLVRHLSVFCCMGIAWVRQFLGCCFIIFSLGCCSITFFLSLGCSYLLVS